MSEDFEIGHELDRALRSMVTGLAQLMERHARMQSERDRASAARAREEWLEQRDHSRRKYLPWTRPGQVEGAPGRQAAQAWAVAAAWSTMDPVARDAEELLAARIQEAHGEHPSTLLRRTDLSEAPQQPAATKLLTMPEVVELANKHAPFYYERHANVVPAGDLPQGAVETRLHEDWQHFAEHGELPERARWEEWANTVGRGEEFAPDRWRTPGGEVDVESRDAELVRVWDEGAEERGLRDFEEHRAAMAEAGMEDLRSQVGPPQEPSWRPLLEQNVFESASPREAAQAWRDANAQGAAGDLAAQAAAAQLAEQVRRKYGVDPNSYLLDAMTDRAAHHAETRRGAEDRARRHAEESLPVTGLDGAGESIALGGPTRGAAPELVTRERVLELNDEAQQFFSSQLRPGSAGHTYLVDRLGEDVMQGPWALGYAPPGWTRLTDHLRKGGATDQELLEAGLGVRSSRGNVIDLFRDRAMVGIKNPDGQLVGFVGRDLSGDQRAPRYLNTGATPAFRKSEEVFGLAEAAPGTRLVRTEGSFDAMAVTLASEGEAAGFAPLGTAMTDSQVALVAERSGGRIWLANDANPAGQTATEADFFALAKHGVDTRVVDLTHGDPAEAWQRDPEQLRTTMAYLDTARPAGEVVIERYVDEHRTELAEGHPGAQQELDALGVRVSEAMADPVEAELISTRVDRVREELVRRSDDAREAAVAMDAAAEQIVREAATTPSAQEATRLEADARVVGARADVTDAVGDRLENRSAQVEPEPKYDRAAESDLDALDDNARSARIDSSHGYSQPTGEMVRGTVGNRRGQAARPSRSQSNRQGRGRSRGR